MLTPQEEQEVLHAARDVPKILDALRGSLDKPGALSLLEKMSHDIYRPDQPNQSYENRIRRAEDERQQRRGASLVWGLVGGGAIAVLEILASIFFGKK